MVSCRQHPKWLILKNKKKKKAKKKYMNREKPKLTLVCESSKKQLNPVIKGFRRLCTLVEKPQKGKTKIIKIVNKITIGGRRRRNGNAK